MLFSLKQEAPAFIGGGTFTGRGMIDGDEWLMSSEDLADIKREENERREYETQLKRLLSTDAGYYVIYKLLDRCGVERAMPSDSTTRSFALRSFGDEILNEVQAVSMDTCMRLIRDLREGKNV